MARPASRRAAFVEIAQDGIALAVATLGAAALTRGGAPQATGWAVLGLALAAARVAQAWAAALRSRLPVAGRAPAKSLAGALAVAAVLALAHGLGAWDGAGAALVVAGLFLPVSLALRLAAGPPARARAALVVGEGTLGGATVTYLERAGWRVAGTLSLPGEAHSGARHLGKSDDLASVLARHPVDEVYLAGRMERQWRALSAALSTCESVGQPFAVPALGLERARPTRGGPIRDGYLHYRCEEPRCVQRALKRAVDVLASGAALVVLSPLLAATALAVKLTSPGPVFFLQERVGQHGRRFAMFKFRSMVRNAEALRASLAAQNEMSGPVFKIRNDPRLTPIGRVLRKYSIDELPQLLNVLRGEMSLVGPRPPIPSEVETYQPWQRRRLSVRPGLTCLWQVSGRNEVSFEEWMYMDLQYIDHWSLPWDFRLLLRTVPVVLTGKGAS